ncbi:hypothetical protein DNK47_03020 [Mycoplasma wenyonii]|uniref:Uncharacterized protein n=1 Tax=Mycoplasma wenyonii TaxID=65123 RepID=A0A328PM51_9MOLU|nr:hypothetical protein DNK47_03020 [Mycoplasma wenyonii]
MTKRLKLGLGGLSFLAINGSILPAIEINLDIFKPLEEISQGGGSLWINEVKARGGKRIYCKVRQRKRSRKYQ